MIHHIKKCICGAIAVMFMATMMPAIANAIDRVRFGVLPVVDTLPLIVAKDSGYFNAEGIDLEIISFQSALERDAALQAGKLDGYFGDILNSILLIQSGQKVKIITTVFHTHPEHRMFGIVTAPGSGITDIAGLQNKGVVISRATVIEYLLDRFLEKRKLGPDYVARQEIKKMQIRLQLLMAGQIDAALLPEPLLTLAEIKGGSVVLDDRILDTVLTVLALDMDRLTRDTSLSKRFLRAYEKAVKAINDNPEAYKEILVTRTRFPMPAKDAYRIPKFPLVGLPSREDFAAVQHWMEDRGMGGRGLSYEQAVMMTEP
jgi:NitT/TauT family transport system substrate-binding protein